MNNESIIKSLTDKLEPLFKKTDKNYELETAFFDYMEMRKHIGNINYEQYMRILNYIRTRGKINNLKIEKELTEDIIYTEAGGIDYRITLSGIDEINKHFKDIYKRKNHVIFTALCTRLGESAIIKKDKEEVIDLSELFIKMKLSAERTIDKKEFNRLMSIMNETKRDNILFRYKQRVSLILEDTENYTLKIDLTNIKMSGFVNQLDSVYPTYELELELYVKKNLNGKDLSKNKQLLQNYVNETLRLIKVLQQSQNIITKSICDDVYNNYVELFGLEGKNITKLEAMPAVSLEIQHVVDNLPNQYNVTDKADGDRVFMIFMDEVAYLISNTLRIRNTGIIVPKEYNKTVLDGEIIFIGKQGKHIFLIFDILFHKGLNVRIKQSLLDRLTLIDDVIDNVFDTKENLNYKQKNVNIQGDELMQFYKNDLTEYFKVMNHNLKQKNNIIVQKKYFLNPTGVYDNEVFKFAQTIWIVCTKSAVCPYKLDGIIFTPLEQKYTSHPKELKKSVYKWKPSEKNSIDFYVKFMRDPVTDKILTLYDNSTQNTLKGKTYKIATLYTGKFIVSQNKEVPVLFQQKYRKYIAYLYLQDGDVRDLTGDPIKDETVVEFYFNNSGEFIDDKYRWIPIKTRYDKTESVYRYGRQYGNSDDTANKIWRSIINPITIDDITSLSNNDSYKTYIASIKEKISKGLIKLERLESAYYQFESKLSKPMRDFHNWIKSNIIYTYCNPRYNSVEKMIVLDIACGRGGDIMKMFFARVDMMVGFDINSVGLYSATNGAISRYEQFKAVNRNFPKMYFIQADATAKLDSESQEKAIGVMTEKNKQMIKRFFENIPEEKRKYQRFNRINCQMAIHYFLKNSTTWNNFCENIKKYTAPGGFMMLTCFDAETLIKEFGTTNRISGYYTDEKGNKQMLFDIIKKFDTSEKILGTGHAIDYHNASFEEEDKYETEYLVDKRFLINELKEKCNMTLVETDMFSRIFYINKEYFMKTAHWEEYYKTRNYLTDTKKFYDQQNEMNKVSFEMSKLYRYYIFHKLPDEKDDYDIKYKDWISEGDVYKRKVPHKTRFEKQERFKGSNKKKTKDDGEYVEHDISREDIAIKGYRKAGDLDYDTNLPESGIEDVKDKGDKQYVKDWKKKYKDIKEKTYLKIENNDEPIDDSDVDRDVIDEEDEPTDDPKLDLNMRQKASKKKSSKKSKKKSSSKKSSRKTKKKP